MSREERRAYQRMMKSQERGPALPPAAKARAERNAARRAARASTADQSAGFTRRFWVRTILIAAALGFLAFSTQWPQMPFALFVGLAVAGVAVAALVGFRLLQRRAATAGGRQGS